MGEPNEPAPVMLIVAAFSRSSSARDWARDNLQNRYGPITLESPLFDFVETHYYDSQMGPELKKMFFAFERLIRPPELVDIKLATNQLERKCAATLTDPNSTAPRPLNLDPGYLDAGKWVLATTKDQAHRLYLERGIYAEVTLYFERGEYRPWPWTYPNYRRDDYRAFLLAARGKYMDMLRRRTSTATGP